MESKRALFVILTGFLMVVHPVGGALINGRYPYYIVEELPENTLIGNVAKEAKLNEKFSEDIYKLLSYRFAPSSNNVGLFKINNSSSILSTAVKIDRDAICRNAVTCHIELDIIIGPDQYYDVIKIVVDIMDINDHSPVFPSVEVSFEIKEGMSYGKIIQLPMAEDTDSRQNSVQSYQLVPNNKQFKLHVNKASDGLIVDLRLEILSHFDYEVANVYQLKLVAYDGGTPGRIGHMMINLNILDQNDNVPQFGSRTYEVFVSESVSPDTVIAKLTATDPDTGVFGLVTYKFSHSTFTQFKDTFDINLLSGEVFLTGQIDFEMSHIYRLDVLASNEALPDKTSTATLVVRVIDTNDWVPHISIVTSQPDGKASVMENAKIGTPVAFVTVTDKDSGLNGQTGCQMDPGSFAVAKTDFGKFRIVTSGPIDREANDSVTVTLLCFDYGDPANEVTAILDIIIEDANDNSPKFDHKEYTVNITENNPPGSSIVTVHATDEDVDENGRVTYHLEEEYDQIFNIHPDTGFITTKISFDREKLSVLKFTVYAKDNGKPALTSSVMVTIDIIDVDDSLPLFMSSSYAFGVYENEAPGTQVGYVVAADHDSPPYDDFYYKILETNQTSTPFAVDESRGKITTLALLDREQLSAYYFTVLAIDRRNPLLTSSASVTVYVADRNDNRPRFIWPDYLDKTVNLNTDARVGHLVTTVVAHDQDLGDNGKIQYAILNGEFSNYFKMNPSTGTIVVAKSLLGIQNIEYISLVISAIDSGGKAKRALSTLEIVLNATQSSGVTSAFEATTLSDNTVSHENTNISYDTKDNKAVIITAISSVSLLLLFVIIMSLFFLRKVSTEKALRGHPSISSFGVNPISQTKDYEYRLEDEC